MVPSSLVTFIRTGVAKLSGTPLSRDPVAPRDRVNSGVSAERSTPLPAKQEMLVPRITGTAASSRNRNEMTSAWLFAWADTRMV